jgi:hypothetical protein
MNTWDALRPAVLPAVSIIAAAVLVRLARGLPFTNPDHFTLDQFRHVSSNLEANARKLRALIFVCLIGVACLIVGKDFAELIASLAPSLPILGLISAKVVSGIIGALITFSFVRVVEVVHSDVALLKLQAKILETAIANKNAKAFEKAVTSERSPGIAGVDKFGTTLPH